MNRPGERVRMVGCRPYAPTDRAAIRDISFRTGFMGESVARFWAHAESWADVWTSYYTDGEPESLSVATIDGTVVGYLAGCVDTAAMRPTVDELLATAIRKHRLLVRRGTAGFLARAIVDGLRDRGRATGEFIDPRWPAHLHIDLLQEARGIGLGAALMQRWLDRLRELGSPGCHLATLFENARAVSFFEQSGFRSHGQLSLVPGMRGHDGGRLHQQIMIREVGDPIAQ
jgi:GNAT superfamily N-acetyltransferase